MDNPQKRKYISHDFTPKEEYRPIRVFDDDMKNIGIYPKSIAIMHKQRTAEDGDIVFVLFKKKIILRRYKKFGNFVMLIPENSSYEPIPISNEEDIVVLGKVVQVINFFDE